MAQVVSIAPGTAAADGAADIAVPAGQVWHIGIYTDHADGFQALVPNQSIVVKIDTPGTPDSIVATLTKENPVVSIRGKVTVRTRREAQPTGAVNIGVFYNDEV